MAWCTVVERWAEERGCESGGGRHIRLVDVEGRRKEELLMGGFGDVRSGSESRVGSDGRGSAIRRRTAQLGDCSL